MPISSNAFVRSTALLLLVGFVALLAIVGTTIWLVEQNQNYFNITVEARSARTAAINLRNAMQDAETGQRGYMLTGEQSYLEPYNEAVPKIPQLLEELKIVLAPYPDSVASVREVEGAIVGKLEEMSRTI